MTDVDRYVMDEAARLSVETFPAVEAPLILEILRAALPSILARHRADVLREAAEVITAYSDRAKTSAAKVNYIWAGSMLHALADEAVAE